MLRRIFTPKKHQQKGSVNFMQLFTSIRTSKYELLLFALILCFTLLAVSREVQAGPPEESTSASTLMGFGQLSSFDFDNNVSIDVVLPENYEKGSKRRYPVIFILDAQRYLLLPMAYQSVLTWKEYSPEFIVVGIKTDGMNRRKTLGKDASNLIRTIEKDIIPFIDGRFDTNSLRVLFGWEKAAGFSVELMSKHPSLFNAYLFASGTFFTKPRLQALETTLRSKGMKNKFVYFTLDEKETWALEENRALEKLLHNYQNITSKFELFTDKNHYSTPLVTINNGLSLFLESYPPLRFYSIKDFEKFGGLSKVKQYYVHRGKRYNTSKEVHEQTIHYLLNQAVNEKNFEVFSYINNAFPSFIENYGYRPIFIKKFAQFCADNKHTGLAKNIYNIGINKHKTAYKLHENLGDLLANTNEVREAIRHYNIAKSILVKNAMENDVNRLNNKLSLVSK